MTAHGNPLPAAPPTPRPAATQPIRVMIIDDSVVVRGLFTRWVAAETDLELAGAAGDGAQGVARIVACDPDVVVLDVEMPVMGGLEALPKLLAAKPGVRVVMASTLTERGASVTMDALQLGASDYVAKPGSGLGGAEAYRVELFSKVRALGARAALRRSGIAPGAPEPASAPSYTAAVVTRRLPQTLTKPEVLVVGASTGGPAALREFFTALNGAWRGPVLVVQHMPPTFTALLADQLAKASPLPALEAEDGMPLEAGRIHVARGDYHMTVSPHGAGFRLSLNQEAQENFCRPAVDPLLRSAAAMFGARTLAVVLTGMGHDGREGARAVVDAGGLVLAQDEASSVVWGMPGAVVQAGLASLIGPTAGLAEAARKLYGGERP